MEQSGLQGYRSEPSTAGYYIFYKELSQTFSREKYEEAGKTIGEGGFGSVKLLRRRETKEVFAGKFVKTNTKQKRQSKLRTSAIVVISGVHDGS